MKNVTRLFDLLDLYRDEFSTVKGAFWYKSANVWNAFSPRDYIEYSDLLSLGFLSLGVTRNTKIGTILVNSPEWNFFDMGIMQTGAVQVPVYPTISEDNYRYILNDSAIEYIIVSNQEIYHRIHNILKDVPSLKAVFSIDEIPGVKNWKEILDLGKKVEDPGKLESIKQSIHPDDLVTIIYTSGTTGRPKGVMLSHHNFVSNYKALAEIPPLEMNDRVVSFLPLCHVYERTAGYVFQSLGVSIYYVRNIDELATAFREVKPHGFAAVPRVLEKAYNRIVTKGRSLKFPLKGLFYWALRQGHKFDFDKKNELYYKVKLTIAYILILRKWKIPFGGKLKFIVCGSAALHPRLTRVFWAARIPVLEAYGLTETSPGVTCYRFTPGGVKFGTVGPLLKDIQVKIAEDGEILVKGPNVMMGYYNRPEKTREAIDPEGWLHTGDIGLLEDGKYLKITDRKKEMFKTSSGKYIAPQVIEQKLKESPFIEHIMVIGENRPYTAALIIPNFEHLQNWCEVKHIEFISREKAILNGEVIKRIAREVERFNQDLGQTEKIKKFRLLAAEWNLDSGEFSPTLKLRRKYILEKYSKLIEEIYSSAR